jgi:predicted PolB exonuclease-like 3'-5' exonuclease
MSGTEQVAYLVFDVESAADGALISSVRYPGQSLAPADAIRRYRQELIDKNGNDFIPYSYQFPVAVAVAKVSRNFRLLDLIVLDEPEFRPHVIADLFWRGTEVYRKSTLVTCNGRCFDLPLLELAAFRYGLNLGGWLSMKGPNYSQPRYRYNTERHLDLYDVLTNFGAARLSGGLNLAASILGKPGKMDVQGYMVQDLFDAGRVDEINAYCRCDVLDTYFVLLRVAVMLGQLKLDREQAIISEAKAWLSNQAEKCRAFQDYLDHWGDWHNPWADEGSKLKVSES